MIKVSIPADLPKCKLIEELARKAEDRLDINFDFFGELESFRKLVTDEVRHINELFPEYTPHDAYYHLTRLFHVADIIVGKDILESMNSTELFLLAISLYGHDWGMAVSVEEREAISTGRNTEKYNLLYNETENFNQYLRINGISSIDITTWQDYIRKTHALRSGQRINKYFETINPGIGEAASRICEAHWLDLKDLIDTAKYPTNFSVLAEGINLRAVSVYLRLIDLFDIGSDRTPYVIWKYVSPRNEFSKMEWSKHRALQPITSSSYQDGRVLIIDGSTDNHNVFAALIDLKNYCDNQLKGCSDIIAQINDPNHKLNIYHCEWRINPRNFKPISVQFEFDRLKMFDVLSDEIYKGDVHVFLRELLQNSVDAIKIRKEILSLENLSSSKIGNIEIFVNHLENGDADIVFSDDGIGMDEYIIKNYLSVAGKSFYSSSDYKKLGLEIDPISRFGVGILSCFMVADEIEIDTFKDPYSTDSKERLKIKIPAVDKQFRIESLNVTGVQVGTKVKIKVLGSKLRAKQYKGEKLNITNYLSEIAGFIEFPIYIHEDDNKSVIINANTDIKKLKYLREGFNIIQFKKSFPFEEAFKPHSIDAAKEKFKEYSFDLEKDLKLQIAGNIIFIVPKDEHCLIRANDAFNILDNKLNEIESIVPEEKWFRGMSYASTLDSTNDNTKYTNRINIFIDGILIKNAHNSFPKQSYLFHNNYFSVTHGVLFPQIVVNMNKSFINRLDLSRTEIMLNEQNYVDVIEEAFENHLIELLIPLFNLSPKETLFKLGYFAQYFHAPINKLIDRLPIANWPFIILNNLQELNVIRYSDIGESIKGLPMPGFYFFKHLISNFYLDNEKINYYDVNWAGDEVIIDTDVEYGDRIQIFSSINEILLIGIRRLLAEVELGFYQNPSSTSPPLPFNIYHKHISKFERYMVELENQQTKNFLENSDKPKIVDLMMLTNIFYYKYHNSELSIEFFPKPFQAKFAYGFHLLNYNNELVKKLIVTICKFITEEKNFKQNINSSIVKDELQKLPFFKYSSSISTLEKLNTILNKLFTSFNLLGLSEKVNWNLQEEDFVSNSIKVNYKGFKNYYNYDSWNHDEAPTFKSIGNELNFDK